MNRSDALLVAWLVLPFAAAFLAGLLPSLGRLLGLAGAAATAAVGVACGLGAFPMPLQLLGTSGIQLEADPHAAPFLLLNATVSATVLLHRPPQSGRRGPFALLLLVLLGSLNTAAVAVDLMSLYVTLEISGIAAFLLVLIQPDGRRLWVALRYLLVSNVAMTLFLVGVALAKLQHDSFLLAVVTGEGQAVTLALLVVGLATKAGLAPAGLWLPQTHAEAPTEVSALLSGMVVAGGLAPLLRLLEVAPQLQEPVRWLGLFSALLGILAALREADAKRLLAWSTVSQLGLTVLAPAVGGFMALAHGLAKTVLFLVVGQAPSRQLSRWPVQRLAAPLAWPLLIAAASIAGLPGLIGGQGKSLLEAASPPGLAPASPSWASAAPPCCCGSGPGVRPWSPRIALLAGSCLCCCPWPACCCRRCCYWALTPGC
ncbi:proton-conducting membrane transporter [Synechococcus sp. RSCCF101]|uniref:proton-conducting transporter transmembrane domain-containing protein n=1 Tax=Synechococcus sp. RSCCF101 TaxID=2511069 RepID=UPI0012457543|nr:proton-conducting transporter membrane subunit [Synechococcus sp. RSCCF101]QEY31202.1 proton-conducting membrane transporter [Synechococcus sp. RSCCF101]